MTKGTTAERAQAGLNMTDGMSPELRMCVHEFGFAIVNACISVGVTKPRIIRHLVNEIWHGARQPQQRRLFEADQISRTLAHLDWLLIQKSAGIDAATLLRVLWQSDMVIVPREPASAMVEASMAEISGHNESVTKREKHTRRLRVAIDAAARKLWPHLFVKSGARAGPQSRPHEGANSRWRRGGSGRRPRGRISTAWARPAARVAAGVRDRGN